MEIFRFTNRIRLRHPNIDPKAITEALAMQPSTQWQVGELRRGLRGQMGELNDHTYWVSEGRRGEDSEELLDVIDGDLAELEKRVGFLREFYESGGSLMYYVSWFTSDRSGGVTVGFRTLERLAKLHMHLALDVYSVERLGEPGRSEDAAA